MDEIQFVEVDHINTLSDIANDHVPVICYGLRTDFRTNLFEGAKRILELAPNIEEIKTKCKFCSKKASFNLKFRDGVPTVSVDEPQIEEGKEDLYRPACSKCYFSKTRESPRTGDETRVSQ